MSPRAIPVDELLSYATRTGDSVRVQVHLRDSDIPAGDATIRLRSARRVLDADAHVVRGEKGILIMFTVAGDLGRRPWRLVLRHPAVDQPAPLEARLLAATGQPVALLPGPTPATEMPAPAPRSSTSTAHQLVRRLPEPLKRPLRRGRSLLATRTRS